MVIVSGCSGNNESTDKVLLKGSWQGIIMMQGQELPFNFEVTGEDAIPTIILINGEERIILEDLVLEGDSLIIPMHVFDAEIKAYIEGEQMTGYWVKNYLNNYRLPFSAHHGHDFRFNPSNAKKEPEDFSGTWRVVFTGMSDTTEAKGIFSQNGNALTGTFLTTTGDYRYLAGSVVGGALYLSAFDGSHAFLFQATKNENGTLSGNFWSGKTWHQTWTGITDPDFELPDPDHLTYLKDGYDKIYFEFPDLDGNIVTPEVEQFKDKVLILQIMGTWCPNCMDETRFLSEWYKKNAHRGVEVLGLAYETRDDFDYARSRVLRMKEKWDVPYPFLIAGVYDKKAAAATLPMLNHVLSFPTTIFIDRKGKVSKIHTGFTGPGTGDYYELFVEEFEATVDKLLAED